MWDDISFWALDGPNKEEIMVKLNKALDEVRKRINYIYRHGPVDLT